jgi:hypothetical protein
MNFVITLLLNSLNPTPAEISAFQSTERGLTYEKAEEHLTAARIAGLVHHVDPNLLLGIAWHESRYTNAETRESGNRYSCGPMTPVPHRGHCSAEERSTVGGYLRGAEHLKMWMDQPRCNGRRERCGVTSYAGGGGLVKICAQYGRSINVFGHNACLTASDILRRTRQIRYALKKATRPTS